VPPFAPVCDTTKFDRANSESSRRMTTAFVLIEQARNSEFTGFSSYRASNAKVCTAIENLLVAIFF